MPWMCWNKVIFIVQANSKRHRTHYAHSGLVALPVEVCREASEARKNVFGKPLVRLVFIALAAYLIAFL